MTVVDVVRDRSTSLARDLAAVSVSRRFVGTCLEEAGPGHLRDDAELAVSELAANGVLHARSALVVRVQVSGTTAQVWVVDTDRRPPTMPSQDVDRLTGRGLHLVAAVTSDWGVDLLPTGKAVWFRVGLPAGSEPAPRLLS